MAKFELPPILESVDEPSGKPEGFPSFSSVDTDDEATFTPIEDSLYPSIGDDEVIIYEEGSLEESPLLEEQGFIEEDSLLDEQELIEEELPVEDKIVSGEILDVKFDNSSEVTVIKLKTKVDLVYLRIPYLEYAAEKGFIIQALYNEDETTKSKSGVVVYSGYDLTVLSMDGEDLFENDSGLQSNAVEDTSDNSFMSRIKAAIAAVKSEARGSNDGLDSDGEIDEENIDDDEEDDSVESNKDDRIPRKKNRSKAGRVGIYRSIANFIYSAIMGFISILSKVPIVGRILGLLKVLSPVVKIVSLLWLPIVLLLIWGGTSSIVGIFSSPRGPIPGEAVRKEDTLISITNKEYKEGSVLIEFVNNSDYYADFYFTGEIKEDKLMGDTTVCLSDILVTAPDEKGSATLKCEIPFETAKIKDIDITLNN